MILIFAGSGASKAVNPDKYPTTIEFLEQLPPAITENALYNALKTHISTIKNQKSSGIIDIEQILWELNELDQFTTRSTSRESISGWLVSNNKIQELSGIHFDFNSYIKSISNVQDQARSLSSKINECVYTLYRHLPSTSELHKTWTPLLEFSTRENKVNIFTTNYDLVLEHVIETGKFPIKTGRQNNITSNLSLDLWVNESSSHALNTGLLTKLHGSIDWIKGDDGEIFVGTPVFTGSHQKHEIIYPGFKGAPQKSPFTIFHDYFRASVKRADAAIFIGFAFRDDYINSILGDHLQSDIPVLLIGKDQLPSAIPFADIPYKYIDSGFNSTSVDEAISWLGDRL